MARLFFYYGPINASKTLHAQATAYNYMENQMRALLVKPKKAGGDADTIDSKPGLSLSCIHMETLQEMTDIDIKGYDAIVVDCAHLLNIQQVRRLTYIVDELNVPVICYGLRTDCNGDLFLGARELFGCADDIAEIRTVCWCGKKAIYNARVDESGHIVKGGAPVYVDEEGCYHYRPLCRKHYKSGLTSRY